MPPGAKSDRMAAKKPGQGIELQILGCGTSTGVPLIHCDCRVCRSSSSRNRRLRASAWIQAGGISLLIDPSIDLRQQAIRARIPRIDAVLVTHPHSDHIGGMDELRSFNFIQKQAIPVFGNGWAEEDLFRRFPYIFTPTGPAEGGGIPQLEFRKLAGKSFNFKGVDVMPLTVMHGTRECLAYRVREIAYVTDCSYIPEDSFSQLADLDVLVLDCLRLTPHPTHLNLERALEVIERVKPRRSYLTHLGHDFDYAKWKRKLPRGVALAYDGLKIRSQAQ
jgi:phosphoribosyl 1,2-cyclic phosphate phosphodiesterase